jgi:hypothetical protein
MAKEIYLWIILSLKFTFDILLSHATNLEQQHYTCKISFDHHNKMLYTTWINKQKLLCARLVTKSMCY